MDKKNSQYIAELEREIISLRAALSSEVSECGDYRIIKVYEARLLNRPDPYDIEELIAKREEMRSRINELQEEIKTLTNE